MTQFEAPSFVIDPDTMDEANEAVSWLLKVPENARNGGKATFWTEQFDVIGASYGVVEDKPERTKVTIQFQVAAESADTTNLGRSFRANYLLNHSSLRDKTSKERTMTMMSLGRIGNFLRAAGLIESGASATSVDLKDFFHGEIPAVIGAKVYAVIKHYKDKEGVPRQDISQFDDLSAAKGA